MIVNTTFDTKSSTCPLDAMGWPSMIMYGKGARAYFPEHNGALSIKCAWSGRETYEIGGMRYTVDTRNYLILNQGQYYSSHVDSEVDSFCIFFSPGLAEDVLRGLSVPEDVLVDDPCID